MIMHRAIGLKRIVSSCTGIVFSEWAPDNVICLIEHQGLVARGRV